MSFFNFTRKSAKDELSTAPNVSTNELGADKQPEHEQKTLSDEQPAQPQSNTSNAKRVHNLIILDKSGSMQSIYQPALTGVNETLQTIREAQKEHEDQTHFVSLIAFSTSHYNQIYHNTPAEEAIDITPKQYRPYGGTPLYDAMGRSINELRRNVERGDVVLVAVITDGYENSSSEYSGKAIKSLVEEIKKDDWVFTYIGANQDVEAIAESMSIDNRLAFEADDECTNAMFDKERRSRKAFYLNLNQMPISDLKDHYFDEDNEDKKDK